MRPQLQVNELRWQERGPYSFTLNAGDAIGIHGESGIGKSFFLRALCDLVPAEGKVLLNGIRREDIAAPQWRRRIALLPTDSQWWHETPAEHFAAPETLTGDMQQLGLNSSLLQQPCMHLSTGQKQRLALLRTLQLQPEILLLDEPTSALDEHNREAEEHFLLEKKKELGFSLILVSHDQQQLRRLTARRFLLTRTTLEEEA